MPPRGTACGRTDRASLQRPSCVRGLRSASRRRQRTQITRPRGLECARTCVAFITIIITTTTTIIYVYIHMYDCYYYYYVILLITISLTSIGGRSSVMRREQRSRNPVLFFHPGAVG